MTSAETITAVAAFAALVIAAMGIITTVIVNTVNRGDDRLAGDLADLGRKVDDIAARLGQLEEGQPRRRMGRRP